ncbi:hypothetical protein J7M28_09585 [bacterium]|nr:hypothetical protein [bacterium]
MLESTKAAASKFGLDAQFIETKANTEKNIRVLGNDLTFLDIRESERTKHVHRLHPYLGKFIPQLVHVFLKKYFRKGQTILDPFAGSGTMLVEANVLGMNSVGVELSPFNVLIQKVKTQEYDIPKLEAEVRDALTRVRSFSRELTNGSCSLLPEGRERFETSSDYLKTWFAARALQEMLFYRSIIDNYENSDVLRVILSRSARSARLIPHYDLARPKKPVRERYWCIKHKRYCQPIDEALKFINRYSLDTVKRIKQFASLRTDATIKICQGDGRNVQLPEDMVIDGVFTSPPYVGIIDYHEQHKYAYELFGFPRLDKHEIGPAKNGQSRNRKNEYVDGIAGVFRNSFRQVRRAGLVFVVANDRFNLYPKIAELSGLHQIDVFQRPVLMRTERDSNKYFESIFCFMKV